jgi:hypothetical protein
MQNLPFEILERIYVHSAINERISPYTSVVNGDVREIKIHPIGSRLAMVNRIFQEISKENLVQAKILVGKYIVQVPDARANVRSLQLQSLFQDASITSTVASIVLTLVMDWKEYRPALDEIFLEFASTFNHAELVRHYSDKTRAETTSKVKLYGLALIQSCMCGHEQVAQVLLEYGADIHSDSDSSIWYASII